MLPDQQEGLVQFSLATGKSMFHPQTSYSDKPDGQGHHDAEAMCFDPKRNCIWINSHDGLTQFTLSDEQFHHVSELDPLVSTKGYTRMVGIDIDPKGRLWLATLPKGILVYDPFARSVTPLFSDSAMQQEIADGNLKIYCDRDGIVWTSYYMLKEIYELIPYSPLVKNFSVNPHKTGSLTSLDIGNMAEGEHGELWVGTADGLNIFNPGKETFNCLREQDLPGIKGNIIFPMAIDIRKQKGWIAAAPPYKVYEINLQNNKCTPVVYHDTLGRMISPVDVFGIASCLTKSGCLFCDGGYGIFEINDDSSIARLVIPVEQGIYKSILVEDSILFLKTFPAHVTYYKTAGGRWLKKSNYLDSIDWDDFFYDTLNETYWVAANGIITHYDKNFHILRSYTDREDLIRGILNMLPDKNGNIWFNDDKKLVGNLNITTGVITMLSAQDGYQKQWYDLYTALPAKADGNLYFVGNSLAPGISLEEVNPDKLNAYPPTQVYFRSIDIKDFTVSPLEGIRDIKQLSLKYFQNRINIEIGVIDYYSIGKSSIRYALEVNGKGAAWQYIPLKSVIHYEDLAPGNYKLIIQGSNTENAFNGPEKILLFTINEAYWNRWWFRVILIALAAFIVLTIFQRRIKKIRQDAYVKNQLKDLEMRR
jgi:streptogramin lyase